MENYRPLSVSVTDPLSDAFQRTKWMLFQPFDISKWFLLGFCAWLATLGQGGGGNFNMSGDIGEPSGGEIEEFKYFFMDNLRWIIPAAIFAILLIITITLVVTWLSSRGKLMFLYGVVYNVAQVSTPWRLYKHLGNSLFGFQVFLAILILFSILLFIGGIFAIGIPMEFEGAAIPFIILLVLIFVLFCFIFGIIQKFTNDFVIPIMFIRNLSVWDAWREFHALLQKHPGKFTIYLLFHLVIGLVIGIGILLLILFTCCLAFCIMAIPYIGTVAFLPVLVFSRSYSLYYLRQYGPEYDIFNRYNYSVPGTPGQQESIKTPPESETIIEPTSQEVDISDHSDQSPEKPDSQINDESQSP